MLSSAPRLTLAVFVGSLAWSCVACTQPGRLLVIVRSDLAVPSELDCVEATVSREGGAVENVPFFLRGADDMPLRFAVEPQGAGLVAIEVTGSRGECGAPGGSPLVRVVARVNVVGGSTRVLDLRLDRACVGQLCGGDATQTCEGGTCVLVPDILSTILPDITDLDAAARDAGVLVDAPGLDAPGLDTFGVDAFGIDVFNLDAARDDAPADPPDAFAPDAFTDDVGSDAGVPETDAGPGVCLPIDARIVSPLRAAFNGFGASVAVSSDRCRVLVGAPDEIRLDGTGTGRARVYRQAGSSWVLEATLDSDAVGAGYGRSLALSADGSRAAVTAYGDGTVRVFLRTGSLWSEEREIPVLSADVGMALGMDGAGARIVISNGLGDVAVWDRASSDWEPGDPVILGFETRSLQLAHDGSRFIVALESERPRVCAVATAGCVPLLGAAAQAVAISGDARRVAIGVLGAGSASGYVDLFDVAGDGSWSPGDRILGVETDFGAALALDSTGAEPAIGTPSTARFGIGSLMTTGPAGSRLGTAADVTEDGTMAVVGAPYTSSSTEAGFVETYRM
ncbi:MAG: hypothetical protein J0L92_17460 [Deltaproteobacteria bacterium]|nr:hypothetical protein [Deltaproteobacteria bacterium]